MKALAGDAAIKAGYGRGLFNGHFSNLRAIVASMGTAVWRIVLRNTKRSKSSCRVYGAAILFGCVVPELCHHFSRAALLCYGHARRKAQLRRTKRREPRYFFFTISPHREKHTHNNLKKNHYHCNTHHHTHTKKTTRRQYNTAPLCHQH